MAVLAAACAQAPVQEMSDARQALQAAREVATRPADQAELKTVERELQEAEKALEAGRYDDARRHAQAAKSGAVTVRERAADSR